MYFADGQTDKHGYGRCHYFSVMDRQTDRQTVAMQIADTDPHWSYELMSQMTDRQTRVVHGSISCDPTQANPSAD